MLVVVIPVPRVTVGVVDVVDVVAVIDRLVPASIAVFVRVSGVMFCVHLVGGHC
ncbi:hypothetical protein [Microbacterium yannicii]|uniref:hypothetical protein n=1 Tax=Microbacterium yannicii TaxID=671622 RepID=UPI001887A5A3|nr:hypothetical protein [Microbacterium yannicii]MCO5953626.1 hypothetical protein [Microbacterium yannicii]